MTNVSNKQPVGNGFPFLWDAEARRELRAQPEALSSRADLPDR
jgi:hypothetical protein